VMHAISTASTMQAASNHALFENSVNAQSKLSHRFRCLFAVVKLGSHPYCEEALRERQNNSADLNSPVNASQIRFTNKNSVAANSIHQAAFSSSKRSLFLRTI